MQPLIQQPQPPRGYCNNTMENNNNNNDNEQKMIPTNILDFPFHADNPQERRKCLYDLATTFESQKMFLRLHSEGISPKQHNNKTFENNRDNSHFNHQDLMLNSKHNSSSDEPFSRNNLNRMHFNPGKDNLERSLEILGQESTMNLVLHNRHLSSEPHDDFPVFSPNKTIACNNHNASTPLTVNTLLCKDLSRNADSHMKNLVQLTSSLSNTMASREQIHLTSPPQRSPVSSCSSTDFYFSFCVVCYFNSIQWFFKLLFWNN